MTPREAAADGPAEQVRNVVLVGPGGAGKTLLTEAILAATGAISRPGSIENGTTVCDFEEVERRVCRSVSLAVASTVVQDPSLLPPDGRPVRINLVDTPGHADFVGELRAGLRAADAALFVISAAESTASSSPIDGATRILWQECADVGMPRAVVVTHIDQPRGDFAAAVENCQLVFGDGVHPLYLPIDPDASADAPTALIGLLSRTVFDTGTGARVARPADDDEADAIAGQRESLIEAVITESEDDGLLDRYLGGEEVGFDTVVDDLETAVARGAFHPVLAADPTTLDRQCERPTGRGGGEDHHRPLRGTGIDRPGVLRRLAARRAGARQRALRAVLRASGGRNLALRARSGRTRRSDLPPAGRHTESDPTCRRRGHRRGGPPCPRRNRRHAVGSC